MHRAVAATLAAATALAIPLITSANLSTGWTTAGHGGQTLASAGSSAPAYTKRAITIPVKVGPERNIACTIAADLYRPAGVSRSNKAAAILTTNGFGGSKDDANQTGIAKGFVQEGYVVLSYSGLGFGGSGCKIYLDSPQYDGVAGKRVVSVLAGHKRAFDADTGKAFRVRYVAKEKPGDPRVGMIGGSYGGQIQYAIAMQDRRLDALIPVITWNDLAYSLAPNNTSLRRGVTYATPGVHKKQWSSFFFAVGIRDGIANAQVDPTRNVGCPNFDDRACTAKAQLDVAGYPDATTTRLARNASVATYLKHIQVPTLVVQGQKDTLFNLQEAVATFKGLRRNGVPTRMVWQSWGHSDGGTPAPGEVDLGADSIRDTYLGRRFLAWMNHHVRGHEKAPVGPRFCYFRDWVRYDTRPAHAGTAIRKAYACRKSYTGDDISQKLYLTGDKGLTKNASAIRPGSASYANVGPASTSYSETSALEGVVVHNPPSDTPGTYAAFTSRPLARAARIVGTPSLVVHLEAPVAAATQSSGPAGKLVLFAKLYDVAPNGRVTLHNRLISPVRVTDVTVPVRVQLPGVVQRIKSGHRIRVVLAASDFAYAGNTVPQPVTITTSENHPGVLRLPLASRPLRFQ